MRIDTLNFLPQFLLDNPDMAELLSVEQRELNNFFDYIELMRNQPTISTASIYLSRYEKMFGLGVSPALSDSERIGRVLAKLNTRTNSTVEAIKVVVSSITGCNTDIEEYCDQYMFMIDVLRDNSQLISVEDIKTAVEIIKPAHLAFAVMMCWKWSIGIKVSTTIYKVAHDVCGNGGSDLDYCGEAPDLSYLGRIESTKIKLQEKEGRYHFPYQFTGQYPVISTLAAIDHQEVEIMTETDVFDYEYDLTSFEAGLSPHIATMGDQTEENGQIEVELETYATPLLFAQESEDYCGED